MRLTDQEYAEMALVLAARRKGRLVTIDGDTLSKPPDSVAPDITERGTGGESRDADSGSDDTPVSGGVRIGGPPSDDSDDEKKGGRRPRRKPEIEGWEAYVASLAKLPQTGTDTSREAVLQYLALWPEDGRGAFKPQGEEEFVSPTYCDRLFELDVGGRLDPDEILNLLAMPKAIARALYIDLTIDHGTGLQPKPGYS